MCAELRPFWQRGTRQGPDHPVPCRHAEGIHAFLSHNHRDKPLVNPLASRLRMLGVEVWLDSWEIAPGDSIPGKGNEALGIADTTLVFWSSNAADSRWVDTEWQTAITRRLSDDSVRIIPTFWMRRRYRHCFGPSCTSL